MSVGKVRHRVALGSLAGDKPVGVAAVGYALQHYPLEVGVGLDHSRLMDAQRRVRSGCGIGYDGPEAVGEPYAAVDAFGAIAFGLTDGDLLFEAGHLLAYLCLETGGDADGQDHDQQRQRGAGNGYHHSRSKPGVPAAGGRALAQAQTASKLQFDSHCGASAVLPG